MKTASYAIKSTKQLETAKEIYIEVTKKSYLWYNIGGKIRRFITIRDYDKKIKYSKKIDYELRISNKYSIRRK